MAKGEDQMPATYEDAALIMQIVRWGTELGLEEAGHALFVEGFEPEEATVEDAAVGKILAFGETISTLVKHEILDKDLLLDLWSVAGTWARVGPAAIRERKRIGEPRLYENYEWLALSPGQ
jgi:hypothetical protein